MKITETKSNCWQVESDSGNTYTVRHRTKLDADGCMYFKWECDCPSRKHPCKHVVAVEEKLERDGEGYCDETTERTI
jgi:uncharacterized Zn finger protein